MYRPIFLLLLWMPYALCAVAHLKIGIDVLLEEQLSLLKGKRIAVVTNNSALNRNIRTTYQLLREHSKDYKIVRIFVPEHGFYGSDYASEDVADQLLGDIPIYSLYGPRRRPGAEALQDIDLLIYDLQDIGSRSYTFISTLFYCMEEAAHYKLPVIVLDRPNPVGGVVVDGPPLEERWRSFVGYINVPYCHGMTVGEIARLFNEEYRVGCALTVIPMRGWKRGMVFAHTGLPWHLPSPYMPESDTPFFYPATGLIGHCALTNIGIGYTTPFKVIGAPWIEGNALATALNRHKLPGVYFHSIQYRPFYGKFASEDCQGVRLFVTQPSRFLPMTTQYTILGVLKQLYPKQFTECLQQMMEDTTRTEIFHKLNGSEEVLPILLQEKYCIWKLRNVCTQTRDLFLPVRKKYLFSDYE